MLHSALQPRSRTSAPSPSASPVSPTTSAAALRTRCAALRCSHVVGASDACRFLLKRFTSNRPRATHWAHSGPRRAVGAHVFVCASCCQLPDSQGCEPNSSCRRLDHFDGTCFEQLVTFCECVISFINLFNFTAINHAAKGYLHNGGCGGQLLDVLTGHVLILSMC